MALLLSFLYGCCCCCCFPTQLPAKPIPAEHQAYIGDWVCENGDAWRIHADGTYSRRTLDTAYRDGKIVDYGPDGTWLRDGFSFGDGEEPIGDRMTVSLGPGPCVTLDSAECIKVEEVPPKEMVGKWERGYWIEIRDDGFVRRYQPAGGANGGALVAGGTEVAVCGAVVPAPWTVEFAEGVLTVDDLSYDLTDPDYDMVRILEAKWESTGSGGGGGGFDLPSGDFDFD